MNGEHVRAAELLATLADAEPGEIEFAQQALSEAIGAGQMDLALGLAPKIPPAKLSTDARILLATDAVKQHHVERALPWLTATGGNGDLTFLSPLVTAWDAAEHGDQARALASLDQIPANSLLAPLHDEEQAFILLKFRRTADADPFARRPWTMIRSTWQVDPKLKLPAPGRRSRWYD